MLLLHQCPNQALGPVYAELMRLRGRAAIVVYANFDNNFNPISPQFKFTHFFLALCPKRAVQHAHLVLSA